MLRVTCVVTRVLSVMTVATCLHAAPAPAQPAPGATCTTLLTGDELTAAIGEAMTDMGAQERSPGETECAWMLRGGTSGFKTVSLQFYDLRAIAATETASAPDAFFELIVDSAEGVASGKREPLDGIGTRAVFVPTDPQGLAVVQRPDGVARIVANNLTRAQVVAVARAVAVP